MESTARQERSRSSEFHRAPIQAVGRYSDDEINLVDIWLILAKHKKFILIILGLATIAGVATALLLPGKYSFTTTIEIGTRLGDNKTTLIEPVESVLAKIDQSYIPLAQNEYRTKHPDDEKVYEVTASNPRKSDIILLVSKSSETEAGTQNFLHQRVMDMLKRDHDRIMSVIRSSILARLHKLERDLKANKENENIIKAQLKRVDVSAGLAKKQIKETESLTRKAEANRSKAVGEAKDEARAMTLLMLDNEVQQNRDKLASLEERVFVNLTNEHDMLKKKLEDNRREYLNIKDQIASTELELKNVQETRAVAPVVKSIKPVGVGKILIVLLALTTGFGITMIAIFLIEISRKVEKISCISVRTAE